MAPPAAPRLLVLYPSNTAVCGVGTWVEMLSDVLTARGWDVTVGLAWGRRFHEPAVIERARPRLKTVRMDGRAGTPFARVAAVRETIARTNPDFVLVTLLGDALTGALLEKQSGRSVHVGVALHGNAPNHLAACLESAPSLDLVTCVNRSCESVLRSLGDARFGSRLHCIPNGVPLPKHERRSQTGRFTVGFVGRLHDDKRVCDLPHVVSTLAMEGNLRVTIAGQGPGESLIRELASQYPETVEYRGHLSRDELYEHVYPTLDALISFSASEGWPLAIAEAMAHGVVPVCSEYSGIHAEGVIRHGATGLIFRVGDHHSAVAELRRLRDDPVFRDRLGNRCAAEMQSGFTVERFGERWDRTLRECLSRPSPMVDPGLAEPPRDAWWRDWPGAGLIAQLRQVRFKTARAEWPPLRSRDDEWLASVTREIGRGEASGSLRCPETNSNAISECMTT